MRLNGDAASTSLWRLMKTSMFSETPEAHNTSIPCYYQHHFLTVGGKAKSKE